MHPLYTAVVTAKAGRGGHIHSEDNVLDLALSVPKGLGGPGGSGTNPEQLFAAGYSACFGQAAMLVAKQKKLQPQSCEITAKVSIHKQGEGFGLSVELVGKFDGLSEAEAHALMEGAHQVCPYSNATRNNMAVQLSVA